jgi:hypothetical protein
MNKVHSDAPEVTLYFLLLEFETERANTGTDPRYPPLPVKKAVDRKLRETWESDALPLDPVAHGVAWWVANQTSFGEHRLYYLHALLHRIDQEVCARERYGVVVPGPSGNATLVIGQVWWERMANLIDGAVEPKYDPNYPFLRLRIVDRPIGTDEWIRAPGAVFEPVFANSANLMRVGLCSLRGNVRTTWRATKEPYRRSFQGFVADGFAVDGRSREEAKALYLDELRDVVRWAKKLGIHVLCLPELCVCPVGLDVIKTEIMHGDDPVSGGKGNSSICMVLPGSYHVEPDGSLDAVAHNVAPVWLFRGSKIAYEGLFRKHCAYPIAVKKAAKIPPLKDVYDAAIVAKYDHIQEDIMPGARFLLADTPVGVVGVLICRDMLSDSLRQRAAKLADHLFIVSMNMTAADEFCTRARDTAHTLGTAFYYVNCRQAAANGMTHLAFACFPINKGDKGDPEAIRNLLFFHGPEFPESPFIKVDGRMMPDDGREVVTVPVNRLVTKAH